MAECKRVLHVLHSMNCGGAETLIMNIYRNIDRSKIQFDFLVNCFEEMYFEDEIKELGGRIYRMKFLTKISPPLYKFKLIRFFEEHREYRIVHSHLETTTGIILSCAKRAGVAGRIAHSHNSRYPRSGSLSILENVYKDYCKNKIVPNATDKLACSKKSAEWLFGSGSRETTIVKNGIETEKYRFSQTAREEVRKEMDISQKTTVLGHAGRFYDQKNHSYLIDVFAEYEKDNPDTMLLLAGEGPLLEQIREKVSSVGLCEKVKFLGLRSDMNKILQGLDAFLLPSKFEGLPLALVEAQCAGLPCYVSDCVSLEGDLGCGLVNFLSLNDSAEKWAKNIRTTALDRDHACGKVAAAGYDIKDTAKKLEELYVKMLRTAE